MKRFFFWFLKPWVLSLTGVTLVAMIIWFEAPGLSFKNSQPFASDYARWCWIALCYLILACVLLWRWYQRRGSNKAIESEKSESSDTSELTILSHRMTEALAILKKAQFGTKRANLYQLPWYIFIGAPRSGKTTALLNSGLTFPLADKINNDSGDTQDCEWRFTEDAVLLDTAGRYTIQDSDQQRDKIAWNGLLNLLRKYRPRRPLNGVIVTISVADLLQQSESERLQQAHHLRARIKELHKQLGIRLPIYVMVTQCDLLAGFSEFFSSLNYEERSQVWGVTFPLAEQPDSALASFPTELALLEKQLQARLMSRMQREPDASNRAVLFGFPQQFAGMGELLNSFLRELFQRTRYEEKPLLRGVYFTSGMQEGTPVDNVVGATAASFGLEQPALSKNEHSVSSYFLTSLLQKVIFPEAGLVGVNRQLEQRRNRLKWIIFCALALLLVVLIALLFNSYLRNQQYVDEVGKQMVSINRLAQDLPPQASELQMLPLLNALRTVPGGYASRDESTPLLMRFGLSQQDKFGTDAKDAYQKMLMQILLPTVQNLMEQQLRRHTANSNDYIYETLRVYLMLGELHHFDPESVTAWLDYYWSHNLNDVNASQLNELSAHAQALMEQFAHSSHPLLLNTDLINEARLSLASMTMSQRVYNRLKRELMRSKLPEFSVSSSAGQLAGQVLIQRNGEPLTRGINGMYTLAGYQEFKVRNPQAVADIVKDSWVLAQQEKVDADHTEQVKTEVTRLYFADYIAQWDTLLANVGIAPFGTLDHGAQIVNLAAGDDSPVRQFLQQVSKETTLTTPAAPAVEQDGVKGRLEKYRQKLDNVLNGASNEAPVTKTVVNPVDVHFDALHKLTFTPAGGKSTLDSVLAMLKNIALYLDTSAAARRTGAPAPAGDVMNKLKLTADSLPSPLTQMVQDISHGASGLTSGSERERLNSLWSAKAGPFCKIAIAGRYPLVRNSDTEVTADDFGKFFAPNGMMDDFFTKNLLSYVDMGGKQWHWRSTAQNTSLGISQQVLDTFQRAARIRDAFFVAGGNQPSMRFELKPVSIDPALTSLSLDIDGQKLSYANGVTTQGMSFVLPGGKGNGQVQFKAVPMLYGDWHTEGSWAWFKMLDKGVQENTEQPERYRLIFNLDGKKAVMELTASSVINPFQRDVLEQFHCMDKLK